MIATREPGRDTLYAHYILGSYHFQGLGVAMDAEEGFRYVDISGQLLPLAALERGD
jgi:TPR repeat protein